MNTTTTTLKFPKRTVAKAAEQTMQAIIEGREEEAERAWKLRHESFWRSLFGLKQKPAPPVDPAWKAKHIKDSILYHGQLKLCRQMLLYCRQPWAPGSIILSLSDAVSLNILSAE